MPRFIRARRTRSSTTSTDQLRDQFIRQLTREAEATLRQMSDQFNRDLERQSSDFLGGLLGGDTRSSGGGSSSFFNLFSSAGRYILSRPKTTTATRESTRSREETDRFRLSQSQLLAEANETIGRGDKNL